MSSLSEPRSLPDLIKELMTDVTTLFRKEVQLAKTEAGESIQKALVGVELLAVAAVLGIGAVGVLLAAAVSGVAALLFSFGMGEAAASGVAALVVGGIVAIIAYVLFKRGMAALRTDNLTLDRTAHSLARDASVLGPGEFGTIYRMRALLANMTTMSRMSPFFQERTVAEDATFFDLMKLLGFTSLTITDGDKLTHQVTIK